jgi:hypothetical protein
VRLELEDRELYKSLRKAVEASPELRRELDVWDSAKSKIPVSNSFLEAMEELREQKRFQRRRTVFLSAVVTVVVCVVAFLLLRQSADLQLGTMDFRFSSAHT